MTPFDADIISRSPLAGVTLYALYRVLCQERVCVDLSLRGGDDGGGVPQEGRVERVEQLLAKLFVL